MSQTSGITVINYEIPPKVEWSRDPVDDLPVFIFTLTKTRITNNVPVVVEAKFDIKPDPNNEADMRKVSNFIMACQTDPDLSRRFWDITYSERIRERQREAREAEQEGIAALDAQVDEANRWQDAYEEYANENGW